MTDAACALGQDETLEDLRRLNGCLMENEWPNIEPPLREIGGREPDFRVGFLAVALVTMEYAPRDINEAFWPHVVKPNMIANSDPRMRLYEWGISNRVLAGSIGMLRFAVAASTAWNYHVDGETLDKMYANKPMPKIKLTPFPVSTDS